MKQMKSATFIIIALGLLAATAMPTKEEQAEAQAIVNELMKDHIAANKKGKESNEDVGDAAMALSKDAQGEAAKFALFRGAVTYYARGKAYDKAADAVEAIMAEISDVPPQTLNGILQKAAANATEKKAPRLVALKKAIAKRAKAAASLKELETKLKKSPSDPSLKRMHAELVAATGDWEAALKEFAALGGDVGKIAEDEANVSASTAAEFWWDYYPAALETKDAIKEHAATLYRRALDYGELEGLKKVLAEKRLAEFTPVLATTSAAPKIEYKFNYRLDGDNAILEMRSRNDPSISPDPVGVVRIPSSIDGHKVIGMGNGSLRNCHKMTKVILPDHLEMLWANSFIRSFSYSSLESIEISSKNPRFVSVDGVLYKKDRTEVLAYPKARDGIKLLASVKRVDSCAFCGSNFKKANIPDGITTMADWVFQASPNLEEVQFPKSLKSIGYNFFAECPKLKRVVFLGDAPDVHGNFFWGASGDIIIEVKKGSKGWKSPDSTELPERWPLQGDSRPIRYIQ